MELSGDDQVLGYGELGNFSVAGFEMVLNRWRLWLNNVKWFFMLGYVILFIVNITVFLWDTLYYDVRDNERIIDPENIIHLKPKYYQNERW